LDAGVALDVDAGDLPFTAKLDVGRFDVTLPLIATAPTNAGYGVLARARDAGTRPRLRVDSARTVVALDLERATAPLVQRPTVDARGWSQRLAPHATTVVAEGAAALLEIEPTLSTRVDVELVASSARDGRRNELRWKYSGIAGNATVVLNLSASS